MAVTLQNKQQIQEFINLDNWREELNKLNKPDLIAIADFVDLPCMSGDTKVKIKEGIIRLLAGDTDENVFDENEASEGAKGGVKFKSVSEVMEDECDNEGLDKFKLRVKMLELEVQKERMKLEFEGKRE